MEILNQKNCIKTMLKSLAMYQFECTIEYSIVSEKRKANSNEYIPFIISIGVWAMLNEHV